jgi:hypothetical protein
MEERIARLVERLKPLDRTSQIHALHEVADTLDTKQRFVVLHELGIYKAESLSGAGSSMKETEVVRKQLPKLIEELSIRSMLDVPCGDLYWMQHVDLGDCDYTGADIVPQLVAQNQGKFGSVERHFVELDLTKDQLPEVDLIFSRDCLIHLGNETLAAAINNMTSAPAKYLLTSHFPDLKENVDIPTGEYRAVNLTLSPCNLPAPMRLIEEDSKLVTSAEGRKCLGLWDLRVMQKG